jgi:uncharacterized membrane protein
MADSGPRPWAVPGPEGRRARLDEVGRLAAEGLDPDEISQRMQIARWVAVRDLETLESERE